MALSSCASLGYTYNKDFCLPIVVDAERENYTFDAGWIAGAFFLGLVLGICLVLLLSKPFIAEWRKKKNQDEEKLLGVSRRNGSIVARAISVSSSKESLQKPPSSPEKTSIGARLWRRKKVPLVSGFEEKLTKKDELDPSLAQGMINVMLQKSNCDSEIELADQDILSVVFMEQSAEKEKSTLMLHILANLLRKKVEKRAITKNYFSSFMKKTTDNAKEMMKIIQRERKKEEEKLLNDTVLNKDSQRLEAEIEKLQIHYNSIQSKQQRDFRDKIRMDLMRQSGMSQAEVEDIMSKLTNNMAVVEERIGREQARQKRAVYQRLAKRRQALEYRELEAEQVEQDIDTRVETFRNLISVHLKGNNRVEKLSDEIVNGCSNDFDIIKKYHTQEYDAKCLEKYVGLQNARIDSFYALLRKQEKEKAAIVYEGEQVSNTIDFIKAYHDLVTKHHMEQESMCLDLDRKEIQEMHKIKEDLTEKENRALDQEVEKCARKLEKLNVTAVDAEKIIKQYKSEMAAYRANKQKEKQVMLASLQERLQQRLNAADDSEAQDHKEQEILKEEQMIILTKVLSSNMDLTEEDKERVLREHEQNMQVLSNQLLCSKLKHQKSLEIKLNQQRARLEELNLQKRNLQRMTKLKEKEDLLEKLDASISKEEEQFEKAHQAAVADLRRQLVMETEVALKLQNDEISLLIGRLQISEAKRKTILRKQDETLKQLQVELDKRLASGKSLPSSITEKILEQHNSHVAQLRRQLKNMKDKQEKIIIEKINAKKMHLEEEIETKLEEDAQFEYTEKQKRGAGRASLAFMQTLLEQRHAKAMQELDTEMLAEFEKCRSDLSIELEAQLLKELKVQEQNLLTQLAAINKMSREDLHDAAATVKSGKSQDWSTDELVKGPRSNVARGKPTVTWDYEDD